MALAEIDRYWLPALVVIYGVVLVATPFIYLITRLLLDYTLRSFAPDFDLTDILRYPAFWIRGDGTEYGLFSVFSGLILWFMGALLWVLASPEEMCSTRGGVRECAEIYLPLSVLFWGLGIFAVCYMVRFVTINLENHMVDRDAHK